MISHPNTKTGYTIAFREKYAEKKKNLLNHLAFLRKHDLPLRSDIIRQLHFKKALRYNDFSVTLSLPFARFPYPWQEVIKSQLKFEHVITPNLLSDILHHRRRLYKAPFMNAICKVSSYHHRIFSHSQPLFEAGRADLLSHDLLLTLFQVIPELSPSHVVFYFNYLDPLLGTTVHLPHRHAVEIFASTSLSLPPPALSHSSVSSSLRSLHT